MSVTEAEMRAIFQEVFENNKAHLTDIKLNRRKQALPTLAVCGGSGGGQWKEVKNGEDWLEFWALFIPNWVQPISLRVHLVISDCI
ncbi:3308_t:CDS:2, partial [Funneliformis caledonium]